MFKGVSIVSKDFKGQNITVLDDITIVTNRKKKNDMDIEQTKGYDLAIAFKPFIDPKCTEHLEIVKDVAKSINRLIETQQIKNNLLTDRIRQFLSALDYDKLSDFQCKCVLLLEKEAVKQTLTQFILHSLEKG